MSTTIAVTKEVTALINVLTFEPENQQAPARQYRKCRQRARWLDLDQLHRRHGSASRGHLLAVARPRISRGMVLAVPFIAPEDLSLSGGYVGAKRMLWFMAHSANAVSRDRDFGIHFQVLAPMQLIPGTTLGHQVAAACAEIEGISIEEHVMQRYGSILRLAQVGEWLWPLTG